MRYLVLSDIHSNLEAFQAVLEDAPSHDAVLFLGDLVGYGPNPNECVAMLRELPEVTSLVGNHDLAALGRADLHAFNSDARRAAEWTSEQLESVHREFLSSLEPRLDLDGLALAHGSPRDPIWEYLLTEEQAPPNFAVFEAPICFVGHTHVPRVFDEIESEGNMVVRVVAPEEDDVLVLDAATRRIVNPGGVGQPRNGDPRAAYGILDTDAGKFAFRRVRYDVETTQEKILEAGLPKVLASRLSLGL